MAELNHKHAPMLKQIHDGPSVATRETAPELCQLIREGKYSEATDLIATDPSSVNLGDEDGWTPLFFAVANKQLEIIDSLVRAGAKINVKDKEGWPLLQEATRRGDPKVVKSLLDAGADPDSRNPRNQTSLHIAYYEGQDEIAKALISAGADENAEAMLGIKPKDMAGLYSQQFKDAIPRFDKQ